MNNQVIDYVSLDGKLAMLAEPDEFNELIRALIAAVKKHFDDHVDAVSSDVLCSSLAFAIEYARTVRDRLTEAAAQVMLVHLTMYVIVMIDSPPQLVQIIDRCAWDQAHAWGNDFITRGIRPDSLWLYIRSRAYSEPEVYNYLASADKFNN